MNNNSSEEEKLIIDIDEIRKNAGKRLDSKEGYDLSNNKSNPNRDSISNININIYIFKIWFIYFIKEMIIIKLYEFLNQTVNRNIDIKQWAIMEAGQNVYDEFELSNYKIDEDKFISDVVKLFSMFYVNFKTQTVFNYEDYLDNNLSIFHFVADYIGNQSQPEVASLIFTSQHIYSEYDLTAFDIPFKEFATFLFYNYIVAIYQLDEEQD